MVVHVYNLSILRSEAGGLHIWSQPVKSYNKGEFTLGDINQHGWLWTQKLCWQSQRRRQLVQICLVTGWTRFLALALKPISGFHKTKVEMSLPVSLDSHSLGRCLRWSFIAGIGGGAAFSDRSPLCHTTVSGCWPCSCLLLTPCQVMNLIL